MLSDRVQVVEVADARTFVRDALGDRALHSSKGCYTKHYIVHDHGDEVAFLSIDSRPDLNLLVIYEIFVLPEIRGRGVGTRVLFAAENLARNLGLPKVRLIPKALGCSPGDERDIQTAKLIKWYEQYGYRAPADSRFAEWQKDL